MRVFSSLSEIKDLNLKQANLAVALGTFDGVHIGHRNVILEAVKLAKQHQGKSAVFTFANHPLSIIAPNHKPPIIDDTLAKIRNIAALGVDYLFNVEFTLELCKMTPEEFIKMLCTNLAPKYLVTGPNYSFGVKGKGTPDLLREFGSQYGFKVYTHHFVYCQNNMVSSTLIRQALLEGNLDIANEMLGHPFSIDEKVIHGKKRGRKLGFPTANLSIRENRVMLPNGVYTVYAYVDGVRYEAIASIGTNPTFSDISRRVEVNIFDFHQDIYDKIIRVDFLQAIRREIKFTSVDALLNQMHKDVAIAKNYFVME